MSNSISVVINGERKEVPGGVNVILLLVHLGLPPGRVAIERNLDILPREQWESTAVAADDRYEIVQLVGGGAQET